MTRPHLWLAALLAAATTIGAAAPEADANARFIKRSCKDFSPKDPRPKEQRESIALRCGPANSWYAYVHSTDAGDWLTLAKYKYAYNLQEKLFDTNRPKGHSFPTLLSGEKSAEVFWVYHGRRACYVLVPMHYVRIPAAPGITKSKLQIFVFDIGRANRPPVLLKIFDSLNAAKRFDRLQVRCR